MKIPAMLWRAASFAAAAAILVLCSTQWSRWEGAARFQATDDAYLQTDLTPLAAEVPGYVQSAPIEDFQQVASGQLIVQIADDEYRARLALAEADVDTAQAQLAQIHAQRPLLEANLRAAQAVMAEAAANLAQNGRDVERQRRLLSTGSTSTEQMEKARTATAELTARLDQNKAQADAVVRQIDLLAAQIQAAEATLEARRAALKQAQINLGYTRIAAPASGTIGVRQVFPGQYLAAGTQVATLAATPKIWVIANYKETQLTRVKPGQRAEITIDTFLGYTLKGRVLAIAPASGAQFALLPPDNATGNFTKIVQRVAVKIAIEDTDGLGALLRPGMSAVPTIDTGAGAGGSP